MKIKEIREIYKKCFDLQDQVSKSYSYQGTTLDSLMVQRDSLIQLSRELFASLPIEVKDAWYYNKCFYQQGGKKYKDTAFLNWQSYPDEMEYQVALDKYRKLKTFA